MTCSAANFATVFSGIFATSFGERNSNIIGCTVDVAKQLGKSGRGLVTIWQIERELRDCMVWSCRHTANTLYTVAKIPTPTHRPLYIVKQKAYRLIRPLVKFYVLNFKRMREYLELEWQLCTDDNSLSLCD